MKRHSPTPRAALLALGAAVSLAGDGRAQTGLQINGRAASFGVRYARPEELTAGLTVGITTGGTLNVSQFRLGPGCLGWVSQRPDFILRLRERVPGLRVTVTATGDTTLVLNAADGRWHCNDDSDGRNPAISLVNPGPGQYDVWVGSYTSGEVLQGDLRIVREVLVEPEGTPTAGTRELLPGASAQTLTLLSRAGGTVRAGQLAPGCTGFLSRLPDLVLRLPLALPVLNLRVSSSEDTTLAMLTPNGRWRCDDNSEGHDPILGLEGLTPGTYPVWVGSRAAGGAVSGSLVLSQTPLFELDGAEGALGAREVSPDAAPWTLPVTHPAGGLLASRVAPQCLGWISRRPDLVLRLPEALPTFSLRMVSPSDTTLTILGPDGQWSCADDTDGSFNPRVTFLGARSGVYRVWVGSYGASGFQGLLHVRTDDPSLWRDAGPDAPDVPAVPDASGDVVTDTP